MLAIVVVFIVLLKAIMLPGVLSEDGDCRLPRDLLIEISKNHIPSFPPFVSQPINEAAIRNKLIPCRHIGNWFPSFSYYTYPPYVKGFQNFNAHTAGIHLMETRPRGTGVFIPQYPDNRQNGDKDKVGENLKRQANNDAHNRIIGNKKNYSGEGSSNPSGKAGLENEKFMLEG
ncbi:hypothetical protein ACFE04_015396 [Oxalis oulophora]